MMIIVMGEKSKGTGKKVTQYYTSHPIPSYPILSYPILSYPILSYPIPFHSIPFHSIPFHSIPFHFISFHFIPSHPIPSHLITRIPVTASDSATRRKEKDSTGSSFGLKNSSTDALNVCLNLPNPGTNMFARLHGTVREGTVRCR